MVLTYNVALDSRYVSDNSILLFFFFLICDLYIDPLSRNEQKNFLNK